MEKKSYDFLLKYMFLGITTVGKTRIISRYWNQTFNQFDYTTIGLDFKILDVELDGYRIKQQIWDNWGQERFRSIALLLLYYK